MPGPGTRRDKKPKPNIATNTEFDESWAVAIISSSEAEYGLCLEATYNAENWMLKADEFSKKIKLPDINTRNGLKKFHDNFDKYYQRLETINSQSQNYPGVRGRVVGIYAKLCEDRVLKTKLFKKGFLKQIFHVLENPCCRRVALLALVTIVQGCSSDLRFEVAEHALPIVQVLEAQPDEEIAAIAFTILWECLSTPLGLIGGQGYYPELIDTLPTTRIVKAAVNDAIKYPHANYYRVHCSIDILTGVARHGGYKPFEACPEAIHLLVAGLKSPEWDLRSKCLQALMRLYSVKGEEEHEKLVQVMTQNPQPPSTIEVLKQLVDYGFDRCDVIISKRCVKEFVALMMKVLKDQDYYDFGAKVAEIVMSTESSFLEGPVLSYVRAIGITSDDKYRMPFSMTSEAMPYAAKIIRNRGEPGDLDTADILDIKYFLHLDRPAEFARIAYRAVKRNPSQAYFYRAIAMAKDPLVGLKAAKEGLKCSQITPYVKYSLLERAVQHATSLGLQILERQPKAGSQKWCEGIACLHSALEDSRIFISEAPPDERHMRLMLCWYIMLMFMMKDLSPDLNEIQPAIRQLDFLERLFPQVDMKPPPSISSNYKLTLEAIARTYNQGMKFRLTSALHLGPTEGVCKDPTTKKSREILAAWLEITDLDDSKTNFHEVFNGLEMQSGIGKFKPNDKLSLYTCGWCGRPSATSRKCTGCSNIAYCDEKCQSRAWPTHKKMCKLRGTTK